METRTTAQTARARKVRAAITVGEQHLKTMKGAPAKPKRKPVSKTRKTRFTQKARANPGVSLDDLIFAGGVVVVVVVVVECDVPIRGPPGVVAGSPCAGDPYARNPYAANPYATKKHAKKSFRSFDAEFEAALRQA